MCKHCGLILDFYKRKIYEDTICCNNYEFDYYILGYYSGLNILPVENWFGLAPHGIKEAKKEYGQKDAILETYPIKLCSPCATDIALSEELGATYQQVSDKITNRSPLLSVMLINITDYGIQQCTSTSGSSFLGQFLHILQNKGIILPQAEAATAIFQCIGYYDFAIICHSKSFKQTYQLQQALRKLNDNGKPYIGNLHIIHGINLRYPQWETTELENQKITLRFTLRPGISFVDLQCSLDKLFQKENCELICTHGRSDNILLCTMPIKDFVSFLKNSGPLARDDNELRKCITTLRTSIRYSPQDLDVSSGRCNQIIEEDTTTQSEIINLRNTFTRALEKLTELDQRLYIHERASYALVHTAEICYSLLSLPYSFEIREIIQPICLSFIRNLYKTFDLIEPSEKFNEIANSETKQLYIHYLVEFIENFRISVGQYLIDLLHCDRFFMEGITLMHPSVGSATKLLFAYNRVLNYTSKRLTISDNGSGNRKCDYNFLVTSGGCDITYADILNNYIPISEEHSDEYKEDRIIVLKISERSLFDIPGTLFRTMHECMHFCGNRQRQNRAENIQKMFCRFFSAYFAGVSMAYKKLLPNKSTIPSHIKNACEEKRKEIACDMAKKLAEQFENDFKLEMQEIDTYSNALLEKLKTHYLHRIIPEANKASRCTAMLYNIRSEARYKLVENIDKICTQEKVHSRAGMYLSENRKYSQYKLNQGDSIHNAKMFINSRFLKICLDFQRIISGMAPEELDIENPDVLEKMQEIVPVSELLDEIFEGFSESFCDSMSCQLLGLQLADYLLAFIFEQWDISIALPSDSMGHYLRIGAVIHVIYPDKLNAEGCLSEQAKAELKATFNKHINEGWWIPNAENLPDIILSSIEDSLKKYQEVNDILNITEPLENYLKQCTEDKKNQNLQGELSDLYKNTYKMKDCDETVQSINAFLSFRRGKEAAAEKEVDN